MPFIAVNSTNMFDPANNIRYATQDAADLRAREILQQFPGSAVFTAQVIQEYSAQVTISTKPPEEVPSPIDEPPAA